MASKAEKNAKRKAAQSRQAKRDAARICGATKRSGEVCKREAGWGTDHPGTGKCKHHSGATRSGKLVAANEELGGMARAMHVSPTQALQAALSLSAGQLAYTTAKVATLRDDELFEEYTNRETGIPTVVYNAWLLLQQKAMTDMAKFAKLAADAGMAERDMSLKENQTALFAQLLEGVLDELGLTEKQRKLVAPAIRAKLVALPGGKQEEAVS